MFILNVRYIIMVTKFTKTQFEELDFYRCLDNKFSISFKNNVINNKLNYKDYNIKSLINLYHEADDWLIVYQDNYNYYKSIADTFNIKNFNAVIKSQKSLIKNLNIYIMSYNKNKFEHNFKKAREQRKFNEKQKLNNLFGIMANVQKDLFK